MERAAQPDVEEIREVRVADVVVVGWVSRDEFVCGNELSVLRRQRLKRHARRSIPQCLKALQLTFEQIRESCPMIR